MSWSEITAQYAGLFFRAEGGDSQAFGTIQAANSPRLNRVQGTTVSGTVGSSIDITANGNTSPWISTGASFTADVIRRGISFTVSGGEVRPRNTAMRIWSRTG